MMKKALIFTLFPFLLTGMARAQFPPSDKLCSEMKKVCINMPFESWEWNGDWDFPQFYVFFTNDSAKDKIDGDDWMIIINYPRHDNTKSLVLIQCVLLGLETKCLPSVISDSLLSLWEPLAKFFWDKQKNNLYALFSCPTELITAELLNYYMIRLANECDWLYPKILKWLKVIQPSVPISIPNDKEQAYIRRLIKEKYGEEERQPLKKTEESGI